MDRLAALFRHRADSSFSESGSDHSPEKPTADLFDLVKSFIEKGDLEFKEGEREDCCTEESDGFSFDSDAGVVKLRNLFGSVENKNEEIRIETEQALKLVGGRSLPGINRQLMAHLRREGFDAGLCKSKMEKPRAFPAGDHEYIDVNFGGNRYIVEIFLAREFEIARPTSKYVSLLNTFPEIFVGTLDELKHVVKLMCSAMKESMKKMNMHVPPWRRNGYMQAKWFGSYKRTTNHKVSGSSEAETSPAEISLPCFKSYHCRGDFGRNAGIRVGNLTAVFGGNELLM
ncbi:uncharacterized protein LOC101205314 [Cucumis sativus]|uniref:uncharacterized protein LOC101205314 n=1 Tax=Cucumis sativus TaxID=3659 RepID=UPI0002B44C01|nr:uncharacterized protein LOC101205314 [Cucumis sativus]KAE8647647.1 hypothetical protein Csa_003601 [Cucumis sativus]